MEKSISNEFNIAGKDYIIKILFFNFFCPIIIDPVKYGVMTGIIFFCDEN